jgi:uncharacterized protein YkwD
MISVSRSLDINTFAVIAHILSTIIEVNHPLSRRQEMKKTKVILSYLRKSCVCLWVVATLAVLVLNGEVALARETYLELAQRMLDTPPEGAEVRKDLESMVFRATNAYRSTLGLQALKPANTQLQFAARAQAMDLLQHNAMGHVSSGGHDFESRMRALHHGQLFLSPMAENAARSRNTKMSDAEKAQALVTQWIKSSGHRKNMVNRTYVTVAIGVVTRGDTVYAVQIFSGPQVRTNILGGNSPQP